MKRMTSSHVAYVCALSIALLGAMSCMPEGDLESAAEENLESVVGGEQESIDDEGATQPEREAIEAELGNPGGPLQATDDAIYYYNADGCAEAVSAGDVKDDGTIEPNACRVTLCWCAGPRSGDPECAHQGCSDPQPACCNLIRRFCAPSVQCSQMLIRPAPGPC